MGRLHDFVFYSLFAKSWNVIIETEKRAKNRKDFPEYCNELYLAKGFMAPRNSLLPTVSRSRFNIEMEMRPWITYD